MKYKLGEKHPTLDLYRVVALKDFGHARAGDIGGWVASEENLVQSGNAWVFDDAEVSGNALVSGDAMVSGDAKVSGNADVSGDAWVYDDAWVFDNARVYNKAEVYDNARVFGDALVFDDAHVFSEARVYDNAWVFDNALVYGNAQVFGDARVFDDAWVCGNERVYNTAFANEDKTQIAGGAKSKMTKRQWTAKITENSDGDSVLEFPDELIQQVGWREGDEVEWDDNGDGSYTLTKKTKSETEWVLVSAIGTYRMRYLVEVPKGKSDYALDTVTAEDAKEFDQLWLGETITDHRVVTEPEALDLFRDSNDIFAQWDDETIKKNHFTFWIEE